MEANKKSSSLGEKNIVALPILATLWLMFCAAMLALFFMGKVQPSESAMALYGFSLVSAVVYAFKQSMKN